MGFRHGASAAGDARDVIAARTPPRAVEGDAAPRVILALLIGELIYQPRLNPITSRIVERAVAVWHEHPDALLVCEAEPMRQLALRLGVPPDRVVTALPQPHGHTTRRLAEWLQGQRAQLPNGPWWMLTHQLHAARAAAMLARCGLPVQPVGVDAPFEPDDADWKLRSDAWFRFYNAGAGIYCRLRGWL
jgi:uncharacterized SAM-binding protein YcdF (DUF218 family)